MRRTLVLAFLLLATACTAGGDDAADSDESGGVDPPAAGVPNDTATDDAVDAEADDAATAAADGGEAAGVGAASADRAATPELAQLPSPPPTLDRGHVIKEGTVQVEVEEGEFQDAFNQVVAAAQRLGGDVVSSSRTTDDDTGARGSVTVRVPVDRYEDLLTGVAGVGEVRGQDITSQDVSAEFTDLESRLRHLQAQEAFYLGLLDDAQVVGDAIAVQQHLSGIQEQVEQAQGRLNFLEDRTAFSTLTVELVEPGVGLLPEPLDGTAERPSLARYWDTARDAFVNVIGAGLVAVFFLAPLAVPAVFAYVAWRLLRQQPARIADQGGVETPTPPRVSAP